MKNKLVTLLLLFATPLCGNSLNMREMWCMVMENHEAIKAGKINDLQANLTVKQTLRRFFPSVNANASVNFSNPTEKVEGGDRLIPSTWRAGGFDVTQPLFDSRFRPAMQTAKYAATATAARTEFELYEILFLASETYLGLLQADALLQVSEDQLNLLENQLEVTRDLYENGQLPVTDLLRSEEAVKQAQRVVHDVRSDRNIYTEHLSNLIGSDAACYTLEPACELAETCASIESLVEEARSRRLDLKSAFAAVEAAKMRLKTEKRNNYPRVDFIGEYTISSPETLAYRNNSYTAAIWLSMPLLDSGKNRLAVQTLDADVAKQELAATRLFKEIQVQVKSACYELESARANYALLEKEVALAQENYMILSERYERGQTSNIDQLNALHAYIQAEANFASARYNLVLLELKLKKETGFFDELVKGEA